jgi:hypothetical protein
VNPISASSWLWKALRGHSVTFAVLMACGLLGVSIVHWLKVGLDALHAPWLAALLVPTFVIGLLAKKEKTWIADEARRRFWARSILAGAAVLAAALAWLRPEAAATTAPENSDTVPASAAAPTSPRPRGPSGK